MVLVEGDCLNGTLTAYLEHLHFCVCAYLLNDVCSVQRVLIVLYLYGHARLKVRDSELPRKILPGVGGRASLNEPEDV